MLSKRTQLIDQGGSHSPYLSADVPNASSTQPGPQKAQIPGSGQHGNRSGERTITATRALQHDHDKLVATSLSRAKQAGGPLPPSHCFAFSNRAFANVSENFSRDVHCPKTYAVSSRPVPVQEDHRLLQQLLQRGFEANYEHAISRCVCALEFLDGSFLRLGAAFRKGLSWSIVKSATWNFVSVVRFRL